MKIIYAGTPDFAVPALQSLINSSYNIVAVYTQPDRPTGRGKKLIPSPVKQLALQHDIPIEQPLNFKETDTRDHLKNYAADIMIVAAYGLILPQAILDTFPLGCINIHASILPRWRGAAPIQRALIAGDSETGISIMQMEKGLDTGPYFCIEKCTIYETDTAQTLQDRLAIMGATTITHILPQISSKTINPTPQNNDAATYAHKLEKNEGKILWNESATLIQRKIRAFNPWPVAFCQVGTELVRIWNAEVIIEKNLDLPGTIVAADKQGITVTCGVDLLKIKDLQFPGGKILSVSQVLNAKQALFNPGKRLC